MKARVDIKPIDLEDDDTIFGYKIKDLRIFAEACRKAEVTDDDLKEFVGNVEKAYTFVRLEQEEALRKAMDKTGYF